ncbi:MAG: MATE family efflux transporter [Oscillospiraceae bacterium]|nr:MATE family efflux transporter [Oscillospiraceae bacterium]
MTISDNRAYSKSILKTLIMLSLPTVAEQLLSTLLQYVDTAMVGRLGEDAAAAVSVTTTVSWLINSVPSALSVAVLAMISKAVGSGDEEKIKSVSAHTAMTVPIVGLILCVIAAVLSPFIPVWMGAEKSIQGQASLYFLIITLPMVFRCSGVIFGAALRATSDMRTPMLVNFGANILNAVLNYFLIYRAGLGVTGAAAATAISYIVSGTFMFLAYRKSKLLRTSLRNFSIDKGLVKEGVTISLPVLGSGAASCLGYVVFASLVTGMGNTVFAAHSIAVTAETIFYISGYGLRTAASAMVGMSLGEGDSRKFETVCRLSAAMTVLMMIVSGAVLYFAAYPLMDFFIESDKAVSLGAEMLRLVALTEPFYGLMIVTEGIFYGLGKTKYAFIIETLSMWGIRILLTFICVNIWGCGLREVWYCMIADNIFKAVMFVLPVSTKTLRKKIFTAAR